MLVVPYNPQQSLSISNKKTSWAIKIDAPSLRQQHTRQHKKLDFSGKDLKVIAAEKTNYVLFCKSRYIVKRNNPVNLAKEVGSNDEGSGQSLCRLNIPTVYNSQILAHNALISVH